MTSDLSDSHVLLTHVNIIFVTPLLRHYSNILHLVARGEADRLADCMDIQHTHLPHIKALRYGRWCGSGGWGEEPSPHKDQTTGGSLPLLSPGLAVWAMDGGVPVTFEHHVSNGTAFSLVVKEPPADVNASLAEGGTGSFRPRDRMRCDRYFHVASQPSNQVSWSVVRPLSRFYPSKMCWWAVEGPANLRVTRHKHTSRPPSSQAWMEESCNTHTKSSHTGNKGSHGGSVWRWLWSAISPLKINVPPGRAAVGVPLPIPEGMGHLLPCDISLNVDVASTIQRRANGTNVTDALAAVAAGLVPTLMAWGPSTLAIFRPRHLPLTNVPLEPHGGVHLPSMSADRHGILQQGRARGMMDAESDPDVFTPRFLPANGTSAGYTVGIVRDPRVAVNLKISANWSTFWTEVGRLYFPYIAAAAVGYLLLHTASAAYRAFCVKPPDAPRARKPLLQWAGKWAGTIVWGMASTQLTHLLPVMESTLDKPLSSNLFRPPSPPIALLALLHALGVLLANSLIAVSELILWIVTSPWCCPMPGRCCRALSWVMGKLVGPVLLLFLLLLSPSMALLGAFVATLAAMHATESRSGRSPAVEWRLGLLAGVLFMVVMRIPALSYTWWLMACCHLRPEDTPMDLPPQQFRTLMRESQHEPTLLFESPFVLRYAPRGGGDKQLALTWNLPSALERLAGLEVTSTAENDSRWAAHLTALVPCAVALVLLGMGRTRRSGTQRRKTEGGNGAHGGVPCSGEAIRGGATSEGGAVRHRVAASDKRPNDSVHQLKSACVEGRDLPSEESCRAENSTYWPLTGLLALQVLVSVCVVWLTQHCGYRCMLWLELSCVMWAMTLWMRCDAHTLLPRMSSIHDR
mmetsp:Transcript_40557/g.115583  ORF Transcript_40557/g.115583 Transcript_40557/m.115583 type:complete len:858 (-) Transcript_40557:1535-4108(-)